MLQYMSIALETQRRNIILFFEQTGSTNPTKEIFEFGKWLGYRQYLQQYRRKTARSSDIIQNPRDILIC